MSVETGSVRESHPEKASGLESPLKISELVHCNAYRNLLNISKSVVSRLAQKKHGFSNPQIFFLKKCGKCGRSSDSTWPVQVGRARGPGKRVLALAISRWPATSQVARESNTTGIWDDMGLSENRVYSQ